MYKCYALLNIDQTCLGFCSILNYAAAEVGDGAGRGLLTIRIQRVKVRKQLRVGPGGCNNGQIC